MSDKNTLSNCPNGESDCPIYTDIADMKDKIQSLSELVRTDHMTGLFNKRHLLFSLEQELERSIRNQQPTTLVLLDVDHFKQVNDTHGHLVGDKVLKHLAATIQRTIRKIDIPCRYGGEEFAIILPSTSTLVGVQVAERIREAIENTAIHFSDEQTLKVTISLGLDTFNYFESTSVDQLIQNADAQLYESKNKGRNQVSYTVKKRDDQSVVSTEEKDALFGPS